MRDAVGCAERLYVIEQGVHAPLNTLDLSNCQRRIRPPFAEGVDCSNLYLMSEVIDIESIRDSLRRIMDRKGVKPTTLSLQVGRNRSLVKDLLEKTTDVQISTLMKLAGALDVELSEILAAPRVPVVGKIGAGGSVIFDEVGSDETVIRPPGISGLLVALEVCGDSMLPKYRDGDIIYIQRNHDGVLLEYIGEDCAVRLASGETYIKQLIRGRDPTRFTLLSLNAPPIEDVEVEWATPVLFIMPSRSRYLFS